MSDETAQTANTVQSTDSAPADVPLEAPSAPTSEVTPPLAKDDNLAQNVPESQPIETPQTAQTGEIPPAPEPNQEQNPAPETPPASPETGTDQTPPTEPLGSVNEPKVSEPEPVFSPAPVSAEPVSPKPNLARQLIAKAREAIQTRKRKKIDHVMDLFAKRTNITNNQVADFLHVSDATATRYLQILENENKVRQIGKTGKGVKYEKI
jgi:ribosomal protein S25